MKKIILASGKITLVSDEDYDYLIRWNWCVIGSRGGGYAGRVELFNSEKITVYLHYVVLDRMGFEVTKGHEPDHKDRNTLNNQRDNLRVLTKSRNRHNTTIQHNNTSGVRGVSFCKANMKWYARISINGERINLGCFREFYDAIEARQRAEQKYGVNYSGD